MIDLHVRNQHIWGLGRVGLVVPMTSTKLRLHWLIGCGLMLATFAGCGTPGAPLPPSLQLARPVDNLTASRKGNRVQLDWTLQRKNTDRTLSQASARSADLPSPGNWLDGQLRKGGRSSSTCAPTATEGQATQGATRGSHAVSSIRFRCSWDKQTLPAL